MTTDNRKWWVIVPATLGLCLGLIALFVPWGAGGSSFFGHVTVYPWGGETGSRGESEVLSWFSDVWLEESKTGTIMLRLSGLGFLAGLVFAGSALITAPSRKWITTGTFGAGGAIVMTAAILLFMNGMRRLSGGYLPGEFWSAGLWVGWTSAVLIATGSVVAFILFGQKNPPHIYQIGMRVGTNHGEGTIVGVDDHVYVQLDDRNNPWRFDPRELHLVVRSHEPPEWVARESGRGRPAQPPGSRD